MELNQGQQAIAEKLAHLLAESPLAADIKETLLENLDKMPDFVLIQLFDSLEKERDDLKHFAYELAELSKKQDADWDQLKKDQEMAMDKVIDRIVKEKEDEVAGH